MNELPIIVTLVLGFLGVIVSIFNQNKRFDEMKERFSDLRDAVKDLRDSMNHRFDEVYVRLDRMGGLVGRSGTAYRAAGRAVDSPIARTLAGYHRQLNIAGVVSAAC